MVDEKISKTCRECLHYPVIFVGFLTEKATCNSKYAEVNAGQEICNDEFIERPKLKSGYCAICVNPSKHSTCRTLRFGDEEAGMSIPCAAFMAPKGKDPRRSHDWTKTETKAEIAAATNSDSDEESIKKEYTVLFRIEDDNR